MGLKEELTCVCLQLLPENSNRQVQPIFPGFWFLPPSIFLLNEVYRGLIQIITWKRHQLFAIFVLLLLVGLKSL